MARKKQRTWLEVAVLNGGFRKAYRAMSWAMNWAYVREAIGHDPTVDEIVEYWARDSRRTAFREQAAWRECFPTLDTPAAMFDTPEMQARIKQMVKAGDDLIEALQEGKKEADLSILQLGMAPSGL